MAAMAALYTRGLSPQLTWLRRAARMRAALLCGHLNP